MTDGSSSSDTDRDPKFPLASHANLNAGEECPQCGFVRSAGDYYENNRSALC